ncbi:V-set domain containing T-cell activation inhibitor 1 isoform X2 [Oreochromis niloticus]|uniref:V-set domain containing T-cell activation inhibitor 1 isoform X2 n=1 Tax=Oreochromis niloticus TaxID=8128 RepID=UPI000674D2F6|nr:V-set domain containing T-cell activation inhibitor 1 isoform X2 [Oreochromis niloticus]CAI5660591.1 unnamed protein product [Mustela putorius furo]
MRISPDTEKITVESGQNATLPCRAQNNNIEVVEWSRADLKDKQYVLLYRDEQFDRTKQHPSFSNRVVLRDRQMKDGDVSFILKNVTTADAGKYECHVLLSGTNRKKRSVYDTKPIKFVDLSVDPPGQTGGAVGLKDGLSPFAVLLVAAVIL